MPKDFKHSFEQKTWEFDCASHQRAQELYQKLLQFPNPSPTIEQMKINCLGRIADLQKKWPALRKFI